MTIRGEIIDNLAARLENITTANGYSTNVVKVHHDIVPMSLELDESEVPAIFVMEGPDDVRQQHGCILGQWEVDLALVHLGEKTNNDMNRFVRDVYKCIFANSATAEVVHAVKGDPPNGIHKAITHISPLPIIPDLNMIEANRYYELSILIHYRTKPYNM